MSEENEVEFILHDDYRNELETMVSSRDEIFQTKYSKIKSIDSKVIMILVYLTIRNISNDKSMKLKKISKNKKGKRCKKSSKSRNKKHKKYKKKRNSKPTCIIFTPTHIEPLLVEQIINSIVKNDTRNIVSNLLLGEWISSTLRKAVSKLNEGFQVFIISPTQKNDECNGISITNINDKTSFIFNKINKVKDDCIDLCFERERK